MTGIATTALPLPLYRRGKVRDVYEVDDARLLIVATDRVSAFDVVMRETVPHKGAVLTQLTAWWLRQLEGRVAHHMLSADADDIARMVPTLDGERDLLRGRAMLVRRTTVFPVECVVRGYIAGSAWKEYAASGTLAGEPMPSGLRESDRLPNSLFSPATKAETGHDENITISRMASIVGTQVAAQLEKLAREVYAFGCSVAEPRGIIIADTKFEFGVVGPEAKAFKRKNVHEGGQAEVHDRRNELYGGRQAEAFEREDLHEGRQAVVHDMRNELHGGRQAEVHDMRNELHGGRQAEVLLIDEVLTPDSSRFWPADRYAPGGTQPSFDKQPLRDYLDAERRAGRWDGNAPPPPLPQEVVSATSARYLDAYRRICGTPLFDSPLDLRVPS